MKRIIAEAVAFVILTTAVLLNLSEFELIYAEEKQISDVNEEYLPDIGESILVRLVNCDSGMFLNNRHNYLWSGNFQNMYYLDFSKPDTQLYFLTVVDTYQGDLVVTLAPFGDKNLKVDVRRYGRKLRAGQDIVIWEEDGTNTQKWILKQHEDFSITLHCYENDNLVIAPSTKEMAGKTQQTLKTCEYEGYDFQKFFLMDVAGLPLYMHSANRELTPDVVNMYRKTLSILDTINTTIELFTDYDIPIFYDLVVSGSIDGDEYFEWVKSYVTKDTEGMIDNGCGTIENFVNVFSFKDVSNIEYYLFSKTVSKGIENWLNAIANGGSVSDVYYDTYVKTAFDVIYSSTDLVVPFLSEDVVSFIEESFQKYGYGNTWSSLGEVCSLFTLDQFFTNWWEGVKLIFGN